MNPLSITRINLVSPYSVWHDKGLYYFKTKADILLAIEFEVDETLTFDGSYWLNLINFTGKQSPSDPGVKRTVITIIEEFFRSNPSVLLYLCDTRDNQQAMRSRLFMRWFDESDTKESFFIKVAEVQDEETINYVAIIVQRSNPKAKTILEQFNREIELFQQKP